MTVRLGTAADCADAGRLLHAFNAEFDEPCPSAGEIAARLQELLAGGDTDVLLAGDGPDGLAVLRFRPSLWSPNLECYLAELYVVPALRGGGIGRALMEAVLEHARERGADHIDLGTSEGDVAARGLYTAMGFSNREADGSVMYVFEREL